MLRCIGESRWHNEALVQPTACLECCGLNGVGLHADKVEGFMWIKAGKEACMAEAVKRVNDKGKGSCLLDFDSVKSTVVHARTESPIGLAGK